jgi:hypothetical protein
VRRQAFLTLTAVINHNFELVASQLNDMYAFHFFVKIVASSHA